MMDSAEHCWFVLRTTYGRERKANDYLNSKNIPTFCPTVRRIKEIHGQRQNVEESRLPNLFFAYGTEQQLTPLVLHNPELPYLRFYCRYYRRNGCLQCQAIRVPQRQMDSLMKICAAEGLDTLLLAESIRKFEHGTLVRVTQGPFCGVEGRIARFKGQQRVGLVVGDSLTALTAYIPTAYVERIQEA